MVMPETTKVRRFGGSLGFIIPKSVADSMALHEGDDLFVTGTPDGISATPYDPDFAAAMDDAREFMRSHRNAFRELAK
jgi:putative addiction module antidote